MENDGLLRKAWWLKYPLLCLMICPVSAAASDHLETGEKTTAVASRASEEVKTQEDFLSLQQEKKTRTLVGKIVDDTDGSPVIGANIRIKGTQTGVISDVNGNFSISVNLGKSTTLEISYIGYKTQTIYVTDQGELNVKMVSDNEMLSEVVIVGAGTQKKISVTGSITSVKGSSLRTPSSSLTNSIAGKLAGVVSTASSGEPGSNSSFYIRGIGTFGGVSTPLILMDGVEISASDLDRIPTESIESFSILKDASATAIYGARGANGVMLVTTKDGELNQRAKINVSVEASLQKPMKFVEYVDGATWMETYNEAALARDKDARYSQEDIDMTRSHKYPNRYPDVNWQDVMFKSHTWNERANINVSGGGSRITY